MRSVLLASLVALGCTSAAPRPVAVTAPRAPIPTSPSKEAIIAKSHAVLLAFDRADIPALEAAWSPLMIHFEGGRSTTRDEELADLKKRKPGPPYIATRTWSDESVQIGTDDALFIGKATEIQGGNDSHGGYRYVGWYVLSWVRESSPGKQDDWKLRLWTWQRGGSNSMRDGWNEIFRNNVGFEKQPNQLMVEIVKTLRPGTALDLAMGQGRNALHLAAQGWKTTGIDISDEGIRIAREEAEKRKLVLTTINANIDDWDFGHEKWDLITMIYPGMNNEKWIEKSKPALKKGGTFILEFFAGDPEHPAAGGYQPGQLAKAFAGSEFTILRDDTIEDRPDWAKDKARLVRFVVKKN